MEQQTKKVNKPMFWVGLAMVVVTAALLFVDFGTWFIAIGILGLVAMGASKYRPMK
tara:strand:- start:3821 stop:3988 length:168 start_codon:yes stop_codon:yes gene_type:complete